MIYMKNRQLIFSINKLRHWIVLSIIRTKFISISMQCAYIGNFQFCPETINNIPHNISASGIFILVHCVINLFLCKCNIRI